MHSSNNLPGRRVVLLGASNLTRGISTVVESAQNVWGMPLDICCALGHGRSYGWTSNFLGRSLPGIVQSGIWRALEERPKLPTAALITDIGNDLMYGAQVAQIARWVETAVDRLQRLDSAIVMTLLPMDSVVNLSPARFRFFAKLFFPTKRLELSDLLARGQELHGTLEAIGKSRGVKLVQQQPQWYGIDPIHIRMRHWRTVWPMILGMAGERNTEIVHAKGSLRRWLYLRTRRAEDWQFFGARRSQKQPCARLQDGTSLSFY